MITSIATAVPRYKQEQMEIFDVVKAIHAGTEEDQRKLRFVYRASGIDTRYSVVPDFGSCSPEKRTLLSVEKEKCASLEDRLDIYDREATKLAIDVIEKCIPTAEGRQAITHLITVSCTGLKAPGLDLGLIRHFDLPNHISRTSVNFMGCYAAIHGLKHAHYIASHEKDAKVLVVCVELCTLHFQTDTSVDNVTSTVIFADGAAAVVVESDKRQTGWRLNNFYSEINFDGSEDMAWRISPTGFLMTLTSRVPHILEKTCGMAIANALHRYGIQQDEVNLWCVHPGGKKILEAIEKGAEIGREDLQTSYDVLRDYGNMSSPTVLFVLEKMINNSPSTVRPQNLVGMAFGPGLTLETFHITYA